MRGGRLARTRLGRRAARLVRSVRERRARPPEREPPEARAHRALRQLAEVEDREPVLRTASSPRLFLVRDRAVVVAGLDPASSHLVPAPLRRSLRAGAAGVTQVSGSVAADVVTLAKFDLGEQTKLRAHYVATGLTVAAQPPVRHGTDGTQNAVRAHEVVARHAPGLAPRMLAHGQLVGGVRYVVEEWVDGAPVMTREGLCEVAPDVLRGLARLHDGYGVTHLAAGTVRGEVFAQRWARTVDTGVVPPVLAERLARVLEDDRMVRVSWTHGDLVASNVLRTPDGRVVLIDWEHSREDLLMKDAAKLHLFSAEPGRTLGQALDLLAGDEPETAVAGELALAHAQLLSRYADRRATLVGHAREAIYEQQVRRQVQLLAAALERT